MELLWLVLKVFGGLFLVGFLIIVWFAIRMIFIGRFTDLSVRLMTPYDLLADAVTVFEMGHGLPPLPYEYRPEGGTGAVAREVLLTPEGRIEDGRRCFDEDPNRTVWWLAAQAGQPERVFVAGDVHAVVDGALERKLTRFAAPALQSVSHVDGLDQRWFLLCGDRVGQAHVDDALWQVDQVSYERHLLTEDPYFTFARPPKVFTPEGFAGTVLVYYVDSVSYGFGGDCSRPKYSVLRVFTASHPEGIDLLRFSFKAGTVVSVDYREGELIATADPSRPGGEQRLPPRLWRISFPGLV